MAFSWKKKILYAQLVFKRRRRELLRKGHSEAVKREERRIK